MGSDNKKTCFIIGPIGNDGSEVRERSDNVLEYIIQPVLEELKFTAIRADRLDKPGTITNQVIDLLMEAPLVIADLTDNNPNVYYELAIRHYEKKPVVQLIQMGQGIPFDIATQRTIGIDLRVDRVKKIKNQLHKQIKEVMHDTFQVDNPITTANAYKKLTKSERPLEKDLAEIMMRIDSLEGRLGNLTRNSTIINATPSFFGGDTIGPISEFLRGRGRERQVFHTPSPPPEPRQNISSLEDDPEVKE